MASEIDDETDSEKRNSSTSVHSPKQTIKVVPKSSKMSHKKSKPAPDKKKSPKPVVKYPCPHCDFETSNIVKHFAHKRQHKDVKKSTFVYKCHMCSYVSKIKGGLQRHIKRVHTKERPFTCPVCNFRTVDKLSMAKHIIEKHKEDFGPDVAMYMNCVKSKSIKSNVNASNTTTVDINESQANVKNESDLQNDDPLNSEGKEKSLKQVILSFLASCFPDTENFKPAEDKSSHNSVEGTLSRGRKRRVTNRKSDDQAGYYRNLYSTPEYKEMRARKLTCEHCHKQCNSHRNLLAHFNEHKDENVFCPICHMFIVDPECRKAHIMNHFNMDNRYVCCTCLSTFSDESEVVSHQQRDHRKSINVIMECMFCPFSSRSQERYSRHLTRCHMFASNVPKHNAFDISKMKQLLSEFENSKLKTPASKKMYQVPENLLFAKTSEDTNKSLSVEDRSYDNSDRESLLDNSIFEFSEHMDESIQDNWDVTGDVNSFNSSVENLSDAKTEISDISNSSISNLHAATSTASKSIQPSCSKSLGDIQPTSSLGQKLLISSVDSSCRNYSGQELDIPVNEFNVPLELLRDSGALKDSNNSTDLEKPLHARIAMVARESENSVSARNIKKMKRRRSQPRSSSGSQLTFPSPDSTSGMK